MYQLVFHPDVQHEIKASYDWYQKQHIGLGDDFLTELEQAYEAISAMPNSWSKFQAKFHRFLLNKFPFSVIYHINHDTIYIVAIMHQSRKPNYWRKRA